MMIAVIQLAPSKWIPYNQSDLLAYSQSDWSPAYSVGDPDLGNSQVGSEVHHPPVTVIRSRPETCLLCQQTVYCFTRVMFCMTTAGCSWGRRGRSGRGGGGGGGREERGEKGEEEEE